MIGFSAVIAAAGISTNARDGSSDGSDVQLPESRDDGAAGPPVTRDPSVGGRCAGSAVAGVQQALLGGWPSFDPARATAASAAAASVLRGALGAPTDGAVDLQYDVPLARWPVDGRAGMGRERVHQEP